MRSSIKKGEWGTKTVPQRYKIFWGTKRPNGVLYPKMGYSWQPWFRTSFFFVRNDEFFFSDLEATLLLLPFDYVQRLLTLMIEYLDHHQSSELCVKCVVFLLKFVTIFLFNLMIFLFFFSTIEFIMVFSHHLINIQILSNNYEHVVWIPSKNFEWVIDRWYEEEKHWRTFLLEHDRFQFGCIKINATRNRRTKRCQIIRRCSREDHRSNRNKETEISTDSVHSWCIGIGSMIVETRNVFNFLFLFSVNEIKREKLW